MSSDFGSQWRGKPQNATSVGTRNLGSEDQPNWVSWLRVRYQRASRVCRFHWTDGKVTGLGGDAWPYPFYGPFRFDSDGNAHLFSFDTGQAICLTCELPEEGNAPQVIIAGRTGPVVALRVEVAR